MLVIGINKLLQCCQITSNGKTYTCPTKNINGELFFEFKNAWHSVFQYISEHAEELVQEDGRVFLSPFKY